MESQKYHTVHLQKLEPQSFHRGKGDKSGQDLWSKKSLWSKEKPPKLLTYEQTCKCTNVGQFNGFFMAFLNAYNYHGDIKITPDDVWMVIMFYFSKYVNDNSEQLRSAFVSHEGKKKLVVETQNQLEETEWDEFFTLMIQEIRKNTTEEVTSQLQCNFSTTGRIQTLLSSAMVMNTFKNYFEYGRMMTLCGIQNVHFGGTLQDWQKVKAKTENLLKYDCNGQLKRYVHSVSEILQKFIETYQGKVDLQFWNKILSIRGTHGSGATTFYSGWLINFFGYWNEVEQIKMDDIDVEIQVDNRITRVIKKVKLVGGFKGYNVEGHVFRPHLSMAIQDAEQKE